MKIKRFYWRYEDFHSRHGGFITNINNSLQTWIFVLETQRNTISFIEKFKRLSHASKGMIFRGGYRMNYFSLMVVDTSSYVLVRGVVISLKNVC